MATSSKRLFSTDIEKDIECSICMEYYKNPKLLHCMHTFCEECLTKLNKIGRNQQIPGEIQCPTCRYITKVDHGVSSLTNDYIMENHIKHNALKTSMTKGSIICIECEKDTAVNFCTDCSLKLCEFCSSYHKRVHRYRNHKIVSITEIPFKDLEEKVRNVCDRHNEVLKYFCATCNIPLCTDCTVSNVHKAHQFNLRDEVVGEKIKLLNIAITSAEERTNGYEKNLKEANNFLQEGKIITSESVKVVEEAFNTIQTSLITAKKELLDWLHAGTKTSSDTISKTTQEVEIFKSTVEYARQLTGFHNKGDVIRPILDATKKIEDYLNDNVNHQGDYPSNARFSFGSASTGLFDGAYRKEDTFASGNTPSVHFGAVPSAFVPLNNFVNPPNSLPGNPLKLNISVREIKRCNNFQQFVDTITRLSNVQNCQNIQANLLANHEPRQQSHGFSFSPMLNDEAFNVYDIKFC